MRGFFIWLNLYILKYLSPSAPKFFTKLPQVDMVQPPNELIKYGPSKSNGITFIHERSNGKLKTRHIRSRDPLKMSILFQEILWKRRIIYQYVDQKILSGTHLWWSNDCNSCSILKILESALWCNLWIVNPMRGSKGAIWSPHAMITWWEPMCHLKHSWIIFLLQLAYRHGRQNIPKNEGWCTQIIQSGKGLLMMIKTWSPP